MRKNDGSKSVALRLAAASQILDRGLGRAAQSVALDLNLTKKLDELSDDQLIALRDRYAALSGTAAPKLIEHSAEQEAPDTCLTMATTQTQADSCTGVSGTRQEN